MRVILTDIPFQSDREWLAKWLGKAAESDAVKDLLGQAVKVAKPKALFYEHRVEAGGKDFVIVEGVMFSSKVLATNLARSLGVFPFAATCGEELENWSEGLSGADKIFADAIMGMGLWQVVKALDQEIIKRHGPGNVCMMNPGSLPDWPLSEQTNLFSLLGDTKDEIGLELLENLFMRPKMSASGIKFYAEFQYENCMLCDKKDCPGRRAEFDAQLSEKYK
jgi:hypothetical protein